MEDSRSRIAAAPRQRPPRPTRMQDSEMTRKGLGKNSDAGLGNDDAESAKVKARKIEERGGEETSESS